MNPFFVLGTTVGQSDILPSYAYALTEADVIAAGARQMEAAEVYLTPYTKRLRLKNPLDAVLDILEAQHRAGRRVVVVADGDPMFHGIGIMLAKRIPATDLRIIPGISAMQIVCARMHLGWHEVESVSMHGVCGWEHLAKALMQHKNVCLLCDAKNQPTHIARWLYERGADWLQMDIFTDINTASESRFSLPLVEAQSLSRGFSAATVVLSPAKDSPFAIRRPYVGMPENVLPHEPQDSSPGALPLYARGTALALLRIQPEHTAWLAGLIDPLLALESSALAELVCVCAPDKQEVLRMQAKRREWAALNMEILEAPQAEALAQLPAPQAICYTPPAADAAQTSFLQALYAALLPQGYLLMLCCNGHDAGFWQEQAQVLFPACVCETLRVDGSQGQGGKPSSKNKESLSYYYIALRKTPDEQTQRS